MGSSRPPPEAHSLSAKGETEVDVSVSFLVLFASVCRDLVQVYLPLCVRDSYT